MISVISSILIWSAVAIIAIRVITTSGNFNATNNVMANLNKDCANHASFNVTNKETACVFGLAFLPSLFLQTSAIDINGQSLLLQLLWQSLLVCSLWHTLCHDRFYKEFL